MSGKIALKARNAYCNDEGEKIHLLLSYTARLCRRSRNSRCAALARLKGLFRKDDTDSQSGSIATFPEESPTNTTDTQPILSDAFAMCPALPPYPAEDDTASEEERVCACVRACVCVWVRACVRA
eukprot:4509639-Alexandrium_andersonii.AAC.1